MFRRINQVILVCTVFVAVHCFPDGGPADTCNNLFILTKHAHTPHLCNNFVSFRFVSFVYCFREAH